MTTFQKDGTSRGERPTARGERPAAHRRALSTYVEAAALPLAGVLLIVVFGILRPTTFLSGGNAASILSSQAALVVVTLGLMVVLIAGDFDLSIGTVVGLSGMTTALLTVEHNVPLPVAVLASLAVGLVVGFVNGFFVVVLNINSLIVTLGMGSVVSGIVLWVSNAHVISGLPAAIVDPVIVWRMAGIPLSFHYAMVVAVVVWYVFRFMPIGRRVVVVGRSREVSRLSGIRVGRIRWAALMVSSTLAALAGLLYVGTAGAAGPTSGLELLLPAFAAAFLGTTAINPGRFNTWGTVIAVYFLVTGITGFQMLGAESYMQDLFYGASLVIAVSLSQIARRRRDA